jgi:hypothetical protein
VTALLPNFAGQLDGFAARVSGYFRTMILTSISNDTQPLSAKSHSAWTEAEKRNDPQGHLQAWRSVPDGQAMADILEPRYRSQYPAKFVDSPTIFSKPDEDSQSVIRESISQNVSPCYVLGVDWLTGSASVGRLSQLRKTLQHYFPDLVFTQGGGRRFFAESETSELGITLQWTAHDHQGSNNHGLLNLIMPGTPWHSLSYENQFMLLLELVLMNFSVSRFDLKGRDESKIITPQGIDEISSVSTEHGGLISGFTKLVPYNGAKKSGEKTTVETFYFGSRKSPRFLRTYNAKKNHGIDAIDWELQSNGKIANETFLEVAKVWDETRDVQQTLKFIGGIIFGCIKFVDRTDKNISRCEELPWFTELKAGFEATKIVVQKVKTTFEKSVKWLRKGTDKPQLLVRLRQLGVKVQEIKDNGLPKVLLRLKSYFSDYEYENFSKVELNSYDINKLSSWETRAQAVNSYSPIFQT